MAVSMPSMIGASITASNAIRASGSELMVPSFFAIPFIISILVLVIAIIGSCFVENGELESKLHNVVVIAFSVCGALGILGMVFAY